MRELSRKVNCFTESRIRQMTILSNEYQAINLAQGFPEFDPPKELTEKLSKVAITGPHQYAPSWGAYNLRDAVAKKKSVELGRRIDPETEVLITCGSTEAMIDVMLTLFDPGDKVILFSPYYTSYLADAIVAQADPIFVELIGEDFTIDWKKLEDAFRKSPKAMILCNPLNPCGKVFTREELQRIANLAIQYDTYVVTDEVYEHIVFEPYHQEYMASLPNMFERTISCSSLSKTYSVTGWRIGYITAAASVIEEIRKIHDIMTVSAASPLQETAVVGLSFQKEYYEELQKIYTAKKKIFINGLDKIGLRHNDPQGTYFVMVDISEFGFDSDVDFCEFLVKEYGVAAVPGSSFFADRNHKWARFHFAKNDDTLYEVIERLSRLKSARGASA